MTLNLEKGQRISLEKNIKKIKVCLGWDVKKPGNTDFDLDASAFLLAKGDKLVDERDVIFYNMARNNNKLMHVSGAIIHTGDDRTGAGDITHSNDKEIITADLARIPTDKEKITFVVTIYDAVNLRQNFGLVSNAFIRVVDADTNSEVLRYNLTEDYSTATAIVAGEVYRYGNEWKFAAIGNGLSGGLQELIRNYGLSI